jgi:hypothetical protein
MFQKEVRMLKRRERSVKVEEKEIRNLRQTLPPFLFQSFFQMVINASLLVKPQVRPIGTRIVFGLSPSLFKSFECLKTLGTR